MPTNQLNLVNFQFGFGAHGIVPDNSPLLVKNSVAATALEIISKEGFQYAKQSAPTSVNPLISGNKNPGKSQLVWLRGLNKCNVFIGEALTKAGLSAPSYKMPDGSYHYVNAENMIKYRSHFQIIQNKTDIQPGDIMIIDYKFAQSENGAHAEIVTECNTRTNFLRTAGAHKDGAYIKDNSAIFKKVGNNLSTNNFLVNLCANVYFLRAKKSL